MLEENQVVTAKEEAPSKYSVQLATGRAAERRGERNQESPEPGGQARKVLWTCAEMERDQKKQGLSGSQENPCIWAL